MAGALERVLQAFPGARLQGKEWATRCPAHDDHDPSLNIREGEQGSVVLICRSRGCPPEAIIAAAGLTMADLFPDHGQHIVHTPQPCMVASYDYQNAEGNLLYQVVRFEPKAFRQRRPDPA